MLPRGKGNSHDRTLLLRTARFCSSLDPCSCRLDCLVQFFPQNLGRWENGQILGNMDAGGAEFEEFDLLSILSGA
jgi:hypothetical protein